jgi:hypothetical protein
VTVSVLVPWRPDGAHRDAAWAWVSRRWADRHPDWQVVVGVAPDGPWCKALAVADALDRADGDLLVIADADVWCDGVGQAVTAVQGGAPWAVPHGKVHRLTAPATALVLEGTDPAAIVGGLARGRYGGVEGGGMAVLTRALYEQAPIDPRFRSWGQEDESWGAALTVVAGKRWRGVTPLWHLWHPPEPRLNQHVGNATSWALHVRYQVASRSQEAMRRLLAEINERG